MRRDPNSKLNRLARFIRDVALGIILGTVIWGGKMMLFKQLGGLPKRSPKYKTNTLIDIILVPLIEELVFTKVVYGTLKTLFQTLVLLISPVAGKLPESPANAKHNRGKEILHRLAILNNVLRLMQVGFIIGMGFLNVVTPEASTIIFQQSILLNAVDFFSFRKKKDLDADIEEYTKEVTKESTSLINNVSAVNTSLIFSAAHNTPQRLSAFIGGMCNTKLYEYTNSLTAPYIRHATNNCLSALYRTQKILLRF